VVGRGGCRVENRRSELGSRTTEIGGDHLLFAPHDIGRAARDRLAELQHDHLVADSEHEAHVVIDKEHRLTGVNEAAQPLTELRAFARVETCGRLVQTDDPRLRNERLPEAAARAGEFAGSKGKLRLPVRGELAGRFGAPREGASLTWKGLLILAPEGEEVRAVADGRVVFAEWMRGFGNLLILDHGEGYLTIYGNNESVLRQVGDAVHAGDVVATVGATGGAQSSGLYFEMRYQGKPFDPLSWVSLK